MIWWARLVVFGPLIVMLGYCIASFVVTVVRAYQDSRQGWTCACGQRFASRSAGPAPFHRLDHG